MHQMIPCPKDWFGEKTEFVPRMSVEVTDSKLLLSFQVNKPPRFNPEAKSGDFVARLSDWDVAEMFLAGSGPEYQEINVSPTGAWWSAHFPSYRSTGEELQYPVEIDTQRNEDGWSMNFSCSLSELRPWQSCPPSDWRLSLTSILYNPDPCYYCWNHFTGGEPDYHRVDIMQPLSFFRV